MKFWRGLDWRIKAVVIPVPLGVAGSYLIWAFGYGHDPKTFFGAVFAAWVGGLILYAVIGSVVAVVSLSHPESESFDARARILFRRQSGKHIDYIIGRLAALEHYTELASIKVKFVGYDEGSKKVLVCGENDTFVRAYIDDIASKFSTYIEYRNITEAPEGREKNRIVYLRVNDDTQPDCSANFDTSIKRPYHVTIEPGELCKISRCSLVWCHSAIEPNTHTPNRYTQKLTLEFENQLPDARAVTIELSVDKGASWEKIELKAGESKIVLRCKDAAPFQEIYRYRVTPD